MILLCFLGSWLCYISFWNQSDFQLSIAVVMFHYIEDMISMIQVLIGFQIEIAVVERLNQA